MSVISIDQTLLDETSRAAKNSKRNRINHNFHQMDDPVHRFLNAIEPDSYIRPHRHLTPPKAEIFLILRGRGAILIFDEEGEVTKRVILDPLQGLHGVEVEAGVMHSILSLEENSVFYEVKQGPYIPMADKDFAPWAPEENSTEAKNYLLGLREIALKENS